MRKFLLTLGAAATLCTGMIATGTTTASADPYWGRHYGGWNGGGYRDDWRYRRHHHRGGGDALAAGAIGLGVGALLGSAIASQPRPAYRSYDPYYYDDRPILEGPAYPAYQERRVYYRPAPVYRDYRPAPVYRAYRPARVQYRQSGYDNHVARCLARYQSYNPRTDMFLSYGGYWKPCRL